MTADCGFSVIAITSTFSVQIKQLSTQFDQLLYFEYTPAIIFSTRCSVHALIWDKVLPQKLVGWFASREGPTHYDPLSSQTSCNAFSAALPRKQVAANFHMKTGVRLPVCTKTPFDPLVACKSGLYVIDLLRGEAQHWSQGWIRPPPLQMNRAPAAVRKDQRNRHLSLLLPSLF